MAWLTDTQIKQLYDGIPDPVLVVDGVGRIKTVNAAAVSAFGYSEHDFASLTADELIHHGAANSDDFKFAHALEGLSGPLRRKLELRRKDGAVLSADITLSAIVTSKQAPERWSLHIRDLSGDIASQAGSLSVDPVLDDALSAISEGFVVFDENDRLVLCNDAYRKIYAESAPAIKKGEKFENIIRYGLEHGQYPLAGSSKQERENWLNVRLTNHCEPGMPLLQNVGVDRWVQVEERVTKGNYRVGLRTDVSALRKVMTEAERLGLIVERVGQEVYIVNRVDGKVIHANQSARQNLQYNLMEIRELQPRDFTSETMHQQILGQNTATTSGESKVVTLDTEHRRKDGSTYMCRERIERLDDAFENLVVVFAEDITERLEFERALERKQQEFETLVRNLPDLITRARPDSTLTYVNENYARYLGCTPEQLLGQKFVDFVKKDARQNVIDYFKSLTIDSPMNTMEHMLQSASGEQRWFLWSNLMIFEEGKAVELVSVGRDITESKEAGERIAEQSRELAQRNDALEQFGAIVSHDLKAPLRHIRIFAEMIAEDLAIGKTDDAIEFSMRVARSAKSLERMVSSLFEYSQLAYKAIEVENFEIGKAISEAWGNQSADAASNGAKLHDDTDMELRADFALLTQLLQNLFANSLKYRRDDVAPEITVAARSMDDCFEITVEDNGIGIDPQYADKIFGVFERLHRDEKKYAGTGIGLAFCQRIAQSHGGSLALDTEFSGGARFILRLPKIPKLQAAPLG